MAYISQPDRTLQETVTTLSPAEVIDSAKKYFARRHNVYAAYLEQESATHATFRGQGGEEIVIGVTSADGRTRVTGSSYLFDQQIARFFSTLPAVKAGSPLSAATP